METNISKSKRLSTVIETMRFPLIFLVVIAHMLSFDTPTVELDFTNYDNLYVFVSEMISHNLARLSVRCYFLISGYYIFKEVTEWNISVYSITIQKKLRTVVLPYLAWNIIMILVILSKNTVFAKLGWNGNDEGYRYLVNYNWYDWIWAGPINFPLWYMRDLIVMIILSPIFYYWFRYLKIYGIIPFIVVYLMAIETGIPGLSTTAFTFFGVGAMFAILKMDILDFSFKIKYLSIIGGLILLLISTIYNGTSNHEHIVRVFIIVGVFTVFNVFFIFTKYPLIRDFFIRYAGSTFFIYVAHEIYIINWLKGGWSMLITNNNVVGRFIGYFLVPLLCIAVCVILFQIWKKLHPKSLAIMTGGRLSSYLQKQKSS